MLALIKVIGIFSTIAVPTGICGVQVFLTKQQQTEQTKKINAEITNNATALKQASENYHKEIDRIQQEKNELLTTKTNLTYVPVNVQQQIQNLNTAKSDYEAKHTTVQSDITAAITAHKASVDSAKAAIENLWKDEKTRVEGIQAKLEQSITTAKAKNITLTSEIEQLKETIDATINEAFYTTP